MIANAPELLLGLEFVWTSFWQLTTCRQSGFGVSPIPWTVIRDYAMYQGLDDEEIADFVFLIRAMDSAFLEHHAPKEDGTPKS